MARQSPADKLARLSKGTRAWEVYAPNDKLFGLTLPEFKNAIKPSLETREQIAELQRQVEIAISRRNDADRESMRILRGVSYSVAGNPDHGSDGLLYEAMGFVRRSARRKRRRKAKARVPGAAESQSAHPTAQPPHPETAPQAE